MIFPINITVWCNPLIAQLVYKPHDYYSYIHLYIAYTIIDHTFIHLAWIWL